MLEDQIRAICREEIAAAFAKRQSDRPDDPLTGGQVRLVHARRSAAGVSGDQLKAELGARWGVDSLTELSQVRLDELLEWLASQRATGDCRFVGERRGARLSAQVPGAHRRRGSQPPMPQRLARGSDGSEAEDAR